MGLLDQFSKQPLVQKYVEGVDFDLQIGPKEEDPGGGSLDHCSGHGSSRWKSLRNMQV